MIRKIVNVKTLLLNSSQVDFIKMQRVVPPVPIVQDKLFAQRQSTYYNYIVYVIEIPDCECFEYLVLVFDVSNNSQSESKYIFHFKPN